MVQQTGTRRPSCRQGQRSSRTFDYRAAHATFDWGKAALDAIDEWYATHTARPLFKWVTKEDGETAKGTSDAMAFT